MCDRLQISDSFSRLLEVRFVQIQLSKIILEPMNCLDIQIFVCHARQNDVFFTACVYFLLCSEIHTYCFEDYCLNLDFGSFLAKETFHRWKNSREELLDVEKYLKEGRIQE